MGPVIRGIGARRFVIAGLVSVVGLAIAGLAAASVSMSGGDARELMLLASGAAMIAFVVAVPVMWFVRRRSVGAQVSVVALVIVGAIALGTYAAAHAMFFSSHDLGAIRVILVTAATVGVAAAVVLGGYVSAVSSSLVEVTRRIGTPDTGGHPAVSGPPELARLAEELQVMETRLDDARRRERAVEESRRELVAWVSHDLRTPLAAIRAMVEALEDGVVSDAPTVARYHQMLREQTDRLAALVDDLFELSRTNAGALRLQIERVSLGDLVSDAIAGVAPVAAAKGVRLEGRVPSPGPEVQVSAPEVLRAVRNVLENAIRHTPPDGSVMVEAGVAEDRAFVSIVDGGGGVPEGELERIFEVGYQVDAARTGGGSGLGLAIARGFVEAHRGSITVSNVASGARFTLELPVRAAV